MMIKTYEQFLYEFFDEKSSYNYKFVKRIKLVYDYFRGENIKTGLMYRISKIIPDFLNIYLGNKLKHYNYIYKFESDNTPSKKDHIIDIGFGLWNEVKKFDENWMYLNSDDVDESPILNNFNQIKILNTVINIIKEFLSQYEVDYITIAAYTKQRIDIYKYILEKKIGKNWKINTKMENNIYVIVANK